MVSNDADYFLYIMNWVSAPGVTRLDLLKLFALFIKIPLQYFYSTENREILSLACFDLPMANNSSFADLHVRVIKIVAFVKEYQFKTDLLANACLFL